MADYGRRRLTGKLTVRAASAIESWALRRLSGNRAGRKLNDTINDKINDQINCSSRITRKAPDYPDRSMWR
jgi:hypothetical protein